MSDQELSLHAEMLGGTEEAYRVARMIEGLLMAQVAMVVDRFGVPDLLAAGPRTAQELAGDVGADADALGRSWLRHRCTGLSAAMTPAGTR